ncbi:N-acetyltransferase [Novosphingobium flavum]|uniref:N-acetyltransferase n=1 Tax=Novosphingobium flavum TaxID=1778672 RepID=A0A7X1KKL2_9SPHN|nr:GNAT family N-acetyltransferase [Novosphingobium flavum]MBC2664661.1 N-acetyltransferase [Novosphingobium flavum]
MNASNGNKALEIEIVAIDQGRAGEYHAKVAGSEAISRMTWTEHDGPDGPVRSANHTLVPRPLEGRGIARRLVERLVADAREKGYKIEPRCSFVEAQFRRHPEWADLRA